MDGFYRIFIIISIIVITLSLCISLIANYIDTINQKKRKRKEFSNSSKSKRKKDIIFSPILINTSSISNDDVNYAIKELVRYTIDIEPDYIVGLNRGGVLVGAHIALAIRVPSENFKKSVVTIESNGKPRIDFNDIADLKGRIVVVDSMVRTGISMQSIIKKIKGKYNKIDELYSVAMVSSLDKMGEKTYRELDFCVYVTQNKNLRLPWNSVNLNLKRRHSKFHEIQNRKLKDYQEAKMKKIEELAREMYSSIE